MKSLLMVFAIIFCLNATAGVAVVNQSKYTCEQLSDYLDQQGEFYVQSLFGPAKIDTVGCSDAQVNYKQCKNVYDYVSAKDGFCEIGLACSCPTKKHGKKHGHKVH